MRSRRRSRTGTGIGLSEFEILDRLAQDGLVKRSMCTDDRRAIFVCLTGNGATRHRDALPTHREVLASTWGE